MFGVEVMVNRIKSLCGNTVAMII